MKPVLSFFTFFTDQPWTIPLIGILVASLAFMVGRRWFVVRSVGVPETAAGEPPSNLVTATMGKKSEPDRRVAPRRKGNRVEVYLTDSSKRPPIMGWVVDRSMGGLCLIVEQPLKEGAVLNVRPRQAPQTAPWTAIEIRSCRADSGEWEIGCRFLKAPQWNDLLLFG
ncbi:MAG TPA: PilZ domain-containing protein [Gemmataceae bacterium]|nr:PilZ domain-containing protein [Gemmataceae bacterium]